MTRKAAWPPAERPKELPRPKRHTANRQALAARRAPSSGPCPRAAEKARAPGRFRRVQGRLFETLAGQRAGKDAS